MDHIHEILESAQASGLVSVDDVGTLRNQLLESEISTRREVAAQLVEKKILTPFQAEEILAGRGAECILAKRYVIRQKLGAGAMGIVFLADDRKLDRLVAIKVLPVSTTADAGAVTRFQREAKALAKMAHPNIIQAYDSDQEGGRYFLVMEYAEGTNLGDLIRAQGRITPPLAADYAYQAALGLQNAHERGLVHRDLKPGNLLLTPHGNIKILDLGLARFLQDHVGDATLTREGVGMGTPDYMPPEQFHDARHVDARSDIYSLGCTLYHFITGRVPFPGSSISEKYAAHEQHEPPPMEEFCPDVPAGLALAVQRMMGKRPADRFQSAREAAEALFPHVAGASRAIQDIKATASWHSSMLTLSITPLRVRRRRRLWIAVGSAVAAVMILMIGFMARGMFPPGSSNTERATPDQAANSGHPPQSGAVASDLPADVITVAQDGSAQFRSLSEALAKVVRPDMTIRVLDDAVYVEALYLSDPNRHAGLRIESQYRATLSVPPESGAATIVSNVPRIKMRGFVIDVRTKTTGIGITGACTGAIFEGITFRGNQMRTTGITVESTLVESGEVPITIRNCLFEGVSNGIEVVSQGLETEHPSPLRGALVENNIFIGNAVAIWMAGRVNDVFLVSNRMENFSGAGIRLSGMMEGSGRLLFANNSFRGVKNCVEFQGLKTQLEGVEIRNNVMSAEYGLDIVAPGAPAELSRAWAVDHNWRQFRTADDDDPALIDWIKPDHDTTLAQLEWGSKEPASEDYLALQDSTAFKAAGAGGDLPGYVGAVAPRGDEAWDWRKTWSERYPKMLLTVSRDSNRGGEFRTINEALLKVTRPGMTIRVLDDTEYHESIQIKRRIFEGLTVESPAHATIVAALAPGNQCIGVIIASVPRVTLRGFRFVQRDHPDLRGILIGVLGNSPGVVIEDVECRAGQPLTNGIHVEDLNLSPNEAPLEIRNCIITNLNLGISLVGMDIASRDARPLSGVIIRNNRIQNCSGDGILVTGRVNHVAIIENRIVDCAESDIFIGDILMGSDRLLIANNTLHNPEGCIRTLGRLTGLSDLRIMNNLILSDAGSEWKSGGTDYDSIALWTIANNYRQHRPPESSEEQRRWLPFTKDRIGERINPVSLDPEHPDFLVPTDAVDLTITDPVDGLPNYIGPVPPTDIPPWNWRNTWTQLKLFPSLVASEEP